MKESLLSERACGRCAYDRTDSRRGVYEVKPPPSESPHYERLCWGCLEASGAWKGRSLEYLNRSKERCERCGFLADDSYPGTRVYWVPTVAFSAVRADVIPGSKIAWSDVRPLRDPEEMRPQPGRYGAYDPTADRRNDLAKLYDENAIPDPNMRPKCTTPVVPHETVAVGICTCEGCSKVRRIAELRAKGLDEAEPLSALEQADVTRMEREFWAMSGRARSVFARMIQTEGR